MEFLEHNQILIKEQSGFRKSHSCETANVINEWKENRDENKTIIVCSLDLKRAFETIDRGLFVNRINARYMVLVKTL